MKVLLDLSVSIGTMAVMPSSQAAAPLSSAGSHMLSARADLDGRRVLFAGVDLPVATLWDVENGWRIQEFVGHTEGGSLRRVEPRRPTGPHRRWQYRNRYAGCAVGGRGGHTRSDPDDRIGILEPLGRRCPDSC